MKGMNKDMKCKGNRGALQSSAPTKRKDIRGALQSSAPTKRKQGGFTTIVLIFSLAIFVLAPLGVIGFEFARANLAREQLRAATDSAALAAAAAMASAPPAMPRNTANPALRIGSEVFKKNTIAGHGLSGARLVPDADLEEPRAGEVCVSFHVLDTNDSGRATEGQSLRVQAKAAIGYLAGFGSFLNLKSQTVRASSIAGLPKLDVIVLLDISASMTKATNAILVQRKSVGNGTSEQAATIHNEYVEIRNTGNDGGEIDEAGRLGMAYQPQRLGSNDEFAFDAEVRNPQGNTGTTPGNLRRNDRGEWVSLPVNGNHFTDSIVDLRAAYPNIFPSLAVLVEASRGNLDNMTNFTRSNAANSGIDPALVGVATKAKYEMLSRQNLQPFLAANNLVRDFVQDLHKSNDVHFGLIPFATLAAQPESDQNAITAVKDWAVSKEYLVSDVGNVSSQPGVLSSRLHQVGLKRDSDNYNDVIDEISRLTPQWGTNTADALYQAKRIIEDGSQLRQSARPVVLLVTDGLPVSLRNANGAGPFSDLIPLNGIPEDRIHPGRQMVNDTFQLATDFGNKGVPIYTVGFLHNADPIKRELGRTVLRTISTNSNNGSGFFLAEDVDQLKNALKNVQRHLITLQN